MSFRWEKLTSDVSRARVPDGWFVRVKDAGVAFYPDGNHSWDGRTQHLEQVVADIQAFQRPHLREVIWHERYGSKIGNLAVVREGLYRFARTQDGDDHADGLGKALEALGVYEHTEPDTTYHSVTVTAAGVLFRAITSLGVPEETWSDARSWLESEGIKVEERP